MHFLIKNKVSVPLIGALITQSRQRRLRKRGLKMNML